MKCFRISLKTEWKKMLVSMPGFIAGVIMVATLGICMAFMAAGYMPKALEFRPFQVGLCVEGNDMLSSYVKQYLNEMESTKGTVEFCLVEESQGKQLLEKKELSVFIFIPEKTVSSIMDGSNVPVQVYFQRGVQNTQTYMEQKVIRTLTECGAALIDVPQAETITMYEIKMEEDRDELLQLEQLIDMFHFSLVMDRMNWFEKASLLELGAYSFRAYYEASICLLLLLLWVVGLGSYVCNQNRERDTILGRKGYSMLLLQSSRWIVFMSTYIVYIIVAMLLDKGKSLGLIVALCFLFMFQSYFIFCIFPNLSGGLFAMLIWNLCGFFLSGGVIPTIFLPQSYQKIATFLPQGIGMEVMLHIFGGKAINVGTYYGRIAIWALFFGLATMTWLKIQEEKGKRS